MKKILFVLLALALVLPMIFAVGAHYENECYGSIPLYTGTIETDGLKEAAYEKYGKHLTPDTYLYVRGDAQPGFSGDSWWLFTDDYEELHVFVEVIDNTILIPDESNHVSMATCCHTDLVEIWIDPTNQLNGYITDDDVITAEAYHYRTDVSGFCSGVLWGNECLGAAACAPYFESKVTMTAQGYDVEFIIHTSVFRDAGQAELNRGEDWAIQLMANNVYNSAHYPYVYSNDINIYYMNSFLLDVSICPGEATHDTANMDYIKLGNEVDDEDDTYEEDPDLGATDSDKDNGGTTPAASDKTEKQNGKTVNKVGDTIAVALAAVVVSAGAAVLVVKKRR